MGRRQAWPGQVLGKSAMELSKKKDYSKGILLRGTTQTKIITNYGNSSKGGGGGCRVSAQIKIIYISNVD